MPKFRIDGIMTLRLGMTDGGGITINYFPASLFKRLRALAWVAVVVTCPTAFPRAAQLPETEAQGAQEVVSRIAEQLFAALDRDSGVRHNANKVLPLVDRLLSPHFDREQAGRLVLGQHWREATQDQRQHFAVALYQRLLRTYAGAVAEWTRDRVKLLPFRGDAEALQVTVHTLVTNSAGAMVTVDYRLHQTVEGWKVYDVVVDGVSYVRLYHDDCEAEVIQKGLDGTIARLERHDTDSGLPRRGTP